jgi:N-methylhydantoinase B
VAIAGADVDVTATQDMRERMVSERGEVPFFDRGPGYRTLSGRDHAEVDFL